MHTRERAHRCKVRRCCSQRTTHVNSRPKSVIVHRIESDGRVVKKSRSTKTSPQRRQPLEELKEHESTLTLMTETLMTVAHNLGTVLNNSKDRKHHPRSAIKRVYVIKFDNKDSNSKRTKRNNRTTCDDYRWKMDRSVNECDQGEGSKALSSPHYGESPDYEIRRNVSSEDSFANILENDVNQKGINETYNNLRQTPTESERNNNERPKCNYKVLYREKFPKRETRKSNTIPDIFDAIMNEIDSLSKHHQRTNLKNKLKARTLSDILESKESLITSDYTIPRSMINNETVNRLQTLIDHVTKKHPERQNEVSSAEVKALEPLRTTLSYYTAVMDDQQGTNMVTSSSTQSGPICRICHERNGTLVRPCRCRGTMAYVHVECLQFWLTEKEVNFCELCNYTFQIIHVPEYKMIPSIGFWYKFAATYQQKKMIMMDLTLAVVLLPILIFLTVLVRSITNISEMEYDEDEEYDENYLWHFLLAAIKVGTFLINLSYVAAVLFRINRHLSTWLSWYINKNVTVVLEDRRHNSAGLGDELD